MNFYKDIGVENHHISNKFEKYNKWMKLSTPKRSTFIVKIGRKEINSPSNSRIASIASLRSSNSTNAYPGGLRATQTLNSLHQQLINQYTSNNIFQKKNEQTFFKWHKAKPKILHSYHINLTHNYLPRSLSKIIFLLFIHKKIK